MRRKVRPWLLAGLLVSLFLITASDKINTKAANAQLEEGTYFFQTGHYLRGSFYTHYQSIPYASFVLGPPITESFTDPLTGHIVQYFQRGRLEYDPLQAEPQVFRTPIGQILFDQSQPTNHSVTELGCRRDFHWNYTVCYEFLELFERYGEEASLGVPVSGLTLEPNGRMTQYFTYGRLEWHTDYPGGAAVTLGDIGKIYFTDIAHGDIAQLKPLPENAGGDNNNRIIELEVHAFTRKAVVQPTNLQSIYVTVHDQSSLPIYNAQVAVNIILPDGQEQLYTSFTNNDGVAKITFRVESEDIGLVEVNVTVVFNELLRDTSRTSFRIWY